MSEHHYAVILAGGKGERFWPLSTSRRPKQLLSLVGDKPLLAQAVDRLAGLIPPERVFVVTNEDLLEGCRAAAPVLPADHVIGEPMGRDTAAAVALGAALVKARDPDGVFCILTADHIIGDLDLFRDTLRAGLEEAESKEVILTIGITPSEPSTGYGYIEAGSPCGQRHGVNLRDVRRFVEKPDRATAEQYVASGDFYWNSGMFIWSLATLESALRAHRPPLADLLDRLCPVVGTADFNGVLRTEYEQLEKISIDYAVMEKAENIIVAEGTFAWDDVGSWTALENHFATDDHANVLVGQGAVLDAQSNIVVSEDRLTALVGVEGLVVVQAPGVTMVCPKNRVQEVKKLVEQLRNSGQHNEVL